MGLEKNLKRRRYIAFVILLVICILWVLPILWSLGTSFKTDIDVATNPISLIPSEWTLEKYIELFNNPDTPVLRWMSNSLIIASINTLLTLIVASFSAYAFSVLKWRGRDRIFWFVLSTMMIPSVINLVPLISMMITFGWFSTWWALIIPGLGGVYSVFLLRQFFLGIPKELFDSGRIDGLGPWGLFRHVVLPLSKSALFVTGLFAFMGSWNDYLWPLIIMSGEVTEMQTLPVGLASLIGTSNTDYGLTLAAAILSIIPVIIVYAFTQEKIIEGVSRTGIK